MEAWSGDDQPAESALLPQIRRRLPGALDAARAAIPDGPGAARVLLRHQVPSAFIPPLAVLLAHQKL